MGILDGRGAVVTGGGRGIGRGHCLHLGANGASVVVNDIDRVEAEKVVAEIAAAGGKAVASDDDITSRAPSSGAASTSSAGSTPSSTTPATCATARSSR
jgi:NAD(P)-dependent dehydrogenase (short-subunit alcohol dehydrogenase family)